MKINLKVWWYCLALAVGLWSVVDGAQTVITGKRFQRYTEPESMGVVTNTTYVRCFWPVSDVPVELFAPGSSGIIVIGPPTPRNVLFPDDTQFVNGTRPDCFFKCVGGSSPENRVEISKAEAKTLKKKKSTGQMQVTK